MECYNVTCPCHSDHGRRPNEEHEGPFCKYLTFEEVKNLTIQTPCKKANGPLVL